VAGALTAENVMDVMQEAKATDALNLLDSCKAFIRTRASEVGPVTTADMNGRVSWCWEGQRTWALRGCGIVALRCVDGRCWRSCRQTTRPS
jgi:hypothetical protein